MESKKPNLKIKFIAGAFDKASERAGLKESRNFTKHVSEMNKRAEVLDRYDEFASLTLPSEIFDKPADSEYGISPVREVHHGKERLLPHQVAATKAFLKELRGFGLLADVVGSGKTFEACSVLSELSAKGKINSALLIVPSQVYDTWIEVLEMKFGLGKGVLIKMGNRLDDESLESNGDGFLVPKAPIIVQTEDFIQWDELQVKNVLFDVIVVDEAHKLCKEEGEYAKALKLLSVMMIAKKQAKKTYCVLLSATPHDGDLAQMFRLWYFIRCKGGDPNDFDVKADDKRTLGYQREKAYYKKHICRGATTVMEFIEMVKEAEVTKNFAVEFDKFLASRKIKNFDKLLIGAKKKLIKEFLDENPAIHDKVFDNIANAYHNGVLRSIMIRQPNDRIRKKKTIKNYFFFPAKSRAKKIAIKGLGEEPLTFYPDAAETDKALQTAGGEYYSIAEYVKNMKGNELYQQAYAKLYFDNRLLSAYGLTEQAFEKQNSLGFYWDQMDSAASSGRESATKEDVHFSFLPYYNNDVYERKLETLKELLTKYKDQRVIIFFDYDIKKEDRCIDKVLETLQADKAFAGRLIVGKEMGKDATIKAFDEKADAILLVADSAFTEGANLQKCNVIVNFQVTPNPLAMEQSIGRIFRLGQKNDVTIYSLADMTALEGYVLMYFNCIGLMNSNDGDAAIIAGCNTNNMVTIRCKACGNVKLMAKDEYEEYKNKDDDEIYCAEREECRQEGKRGIQMQEINSNEERCDSCHNVIRRQDSNDGGQFHCLSKSGYGSGVMCNKGELGDRSLYCRKICVIAHCSRFLTGAMAGKCAALNEYQQNPNVSDMALQELCYNCRYSEECKDKCKIGFGEKAIAGCSTCRESTCKPNPHVINFNERWEAKCPKCNGTLRPVVARTFEMYIRSAFEYKQDGGKSFCDNFSKECKKVAEIKEILSNDKTRDDNE